jgi:hypothetical protein
MSRLLNNGTYSDAEFVHIPEGQKQQLAEGVATFIEQQTKSMALASGASTNEDVLNKDVCGACISHVTVLTLVELAKRNNIPLSELAYTAHSLYAIGQGGEREADHYRMQVEYRQPIWQASYKSA